MAEREGLLVVVERAVVLAGVGLIGSSSCLVSRARHRVITKWSSRARVSLLMLVFRHLCSWSWSCSCRHIYSSSCL